MVTELSSVEKLRLQSFIMERLEKKYGSFPLPETIQRHRQREIFTQKQAPKKWRTNIISIKKSNPTE